MKTARLAINGFGRIGRAAFKIALEKGAEIVAINDLTEPHVLAHLLKYDTAYGKYEREVSADDHNLIVDCKKIRILAEPEPEKLPWKELNVDIVLECTGRFVKDDASLAHINAGAKKVILSGPAKGGEIQTFIKSVNYDQYLGQNSISNSSCTTNCTAPVIKILDENFKVQKAIMTTIHAATATQNVVDVAPKDDDLRRARSALANMIPTSSGSAKDTAKTISQLEGKFDSIAVRVPIITGSLVDLVALVEKDTTVKEINSVFEKAAKEKRFDGILTVSHEPLVSSDIIKDPHSAIVDLEMTRVVDKNLIKILAWYDNEWGYANRLVEMAIDMA